MDLTNARMITISLAKQPDGTWKWSASVDAKPVGGGSGKDPDDAVDQAEQLMWPEAESAEGEGEDEEAGEQSPDDEGSEPAPGAVPTHSQMWASEAKKRNDRASDLAKL